MNQIRGVTLIVAALLLIASTTLIGAQSTKAKSNKTPSKPKLSAKKTYSYTMMRGGKTYQITCDKELPLAAMNADIQLANQAESLKGELNRLRSQYQHELERNSNNEQKVDDLKEEVDQLKEDNDQKKRELEEKENELEEVKDELKELEREAEEVKSAFSMFEISFGSLKRAVRALSYDDWKSAVPYVESRFRSADLDFFSLDLAMGGLP